MDEEKREGLLWRAKKRSKEALQGQLEEKKTMFSKPEIKEEKQDGLNICSPNTAKMSVKEFKIT